MNQIQNNYRLVIVGAGPAGTAILILAARIKELENLLDSKIAVLDRGKQMGTGVIGNYIVNSDTNSIVFLKTLDKLKNDVVFEKVFHSESYKILQKYQETSIPLKLAGEFFAEIGNALQSKIDNHPTSGFFPYTIAKSLQLSTTGNIIIRTITKNDTKMPQEQEFYSQKVLMTIGGKQIREKALAEKIVKDLSLQGKLSERVLLSDFVLTQEGVAEVSQRLQKSSRKNVVIIGGSNSGFSVAWMLLNKLKGVKFSSSDIKLLHRNKVKLCYGSPQEAFADGYQDFTPEDVCPITKRVYRLGGIRGDSKELFRQIMGWSKQKVENRVELIKLREDNTTFQKVHSLLQEAVLIITAYGYDTNLLPIYDAQGKEIDLLCDHRGPRVDSFGRVLAKNGKIIPNILAMGLGAGFRYSEKSGGEKTFTGEINGTWIYQNTIGEIIFNQIMNH